MKSKQAQPCPESKEMRAFLAEEAARAARVHRLNELQALIGVAARLLNEQRGRFESSYVYGPPPPVTPDHLKLWVVHDWLPALRALEALRGNLGQTGRVVLERPLSSHINERVRRGVKAMQDIFRMLDDQSTPDDNSGFVARELAHFLRADSNASFYFDRMVEWAVVLLERLANQVERQAETLRVDGLGDLARSLWVDQFTPEAPKQKRTGRPPVRDPALDHELLVRRRHGSSFADLATLQGISVHDVKLGIARAHSSDYRKRTAHKPQASTNKHKSTGAKTRSRLK